GHGTPHHPAGEPSAAPRFCSGALNRASFRYLGARMKVGTKTAWLLRPILAEAAMLAPVTFCGAQPRAEPQPQQQIEAPQPKQTISQQTTIAEARRMAQQGKFDEAIGQLDCLPPSKPLPRAPSLN